jgi:ATP-binding cassette subfamily B protein
VTGDVQNVRLFVDGVIVQTIVLILSVTVYLFYMLHIHVQLTLACLASTPLLGFLTWAYLGKVKPASLKTRELTDAMIRTLSENTQGVHVIKGFAREPEEISKFAQANRNVTEQQNWTFWLTSVFSPLISFIPQVNMVVLLCYGGYLLSHDPTFTLGQGIIVFAGLLRQFENQVSTIATIANSAQQSLTGAQRVFEILDAPVEIQSKPNATRLPRAQGTIRFDNVSFGYRAEDSVLQDINFEVPAGSSIAITGANGAGKSTLLSLIPRFYDPDKGRVLLDGIDLRDLDLDDLRRNIGLVFQESFSFPTLWQLTSRLVIPKRHRKISNVRHASLRRTTSLWNCPTATTQFWANGAAACLVDSGSAWPLRVRFCLIRRSCCWMTRLRPLTLKQNMRFRSDAGRDAEPHLVCGGAPSEHPAPCRPSTRTRSGSHR